VESKEIPIPEPVPRLTRDGDSERRETALLLAAQINEASMLAGVGASVLLGSFNQINMCAGLKTRPATAPCRDLPIRV
jgi:hypothetical protein